MPDLLLPDEDLLRICQMDFKAAQQTREQVEQVKLAHYSLYRGWDPNTNPVGGNQAATATSSPTGQFGWSRLEVPITYISVETILSRMVLNDPEIMAFGETPEAAPYAQAKVMRVKHDLARSGWEDIQINCLKDSAIYGDGYTKTTWDPDKSHPLVERVPWFDFYYSPDAMTHDLAEVHWHVTWHTKASLDALSERMGKDKEPLYKNIDQLLLKSGDRSASDNTYLTRRQYSGAGTPAATSDEQRQIPIIEGWYRDGTVITLGGNNAELLLRAVPCPYVDPDNRPWRPFDTFAGTPDPESPYSISIVEKLEDMQREASTLTRQAIDQATRNINRPTAYDATRVRDADVAAAYGTPGGRLPVSGSPQDAIDEGRDVQVSRDWETAINRVMQLAQMTAGISDESAGMPPTTRPGLEDTATGAWLRAHERNRRVGFLVTLVSRTMRSIACKLDWLDRQYNKSAMAIPLSKHVKLDPSQEGVRIHASGQVAIVDNKVNDPKMRYQIKIDDGSLEVGFAGQRAARAVALSQALSTNPLLAQQVNWSELAAVLAEASGFDPGRVLMTQTPGIAEPGAPLPPGAPADALPPGAPSPTANGAAPAGPPAAPVPVGPPIPLGAGPPPVGPPFQNGIPGTGPLGPGVPPDQIAALLAQQFGGAAPFPPEVGAPPGVGGGMPSPAPLPEASGAGGGQQPVTININAGDGGVSMPQPEAPPAPAAPTVKRVIFLRDEQGQLAGAEIEEIPQEPPDTGLPPDMGMAPDQGGLPPDLVDQLGGM